MGVIDGEVVQQGQGFANGFHVLIVDVIGALGGGLRDSGFVPVCA